MNTKCKAAGTILLLLGCAWLSSCSQTRQQRPEQLPFPLLPPASFGQQLELTQQMTVNFNGERHELLIYSDIDTQEISIVGTLPNGVRVFNISYDGGSLYSETYGGLIDLLGADYFLADFQLALWPLRVLQEGLAKEGNCFAQGTCRLTQSADRLERTLSMEGEEAVSIRYSGLPRYQGNINFDHRQRGYELQINTLEATTEAE